MQDQACVRGDNCPYAHNVFEYWLHPTRYRTQLCNDMEKCNRKVSLMPCPSPSTARQLWQAREAAPILAHHQTSARQGPRLS